MRHLRALIVTSLTLVLLLTACNFPFPGSKNLPTDTVLTIAVKTVNAQLTAVGLQATTPAASTSIPATATPLPTATRVPPSSTPRPIPTSAPVYVPCDRAEFVSDVNVPDGTKFNPNQSFSKTWRLRNTGSCNWTTAYALSFDSGESMGGPASMGLPGPVGPGQYIDVTVNLKAPAAAGKYRGFWRLRNSSGASFGIGVNASVSFWVDIEVINLTATPTATLTSAATLTIYDFANNYCAATWMSSASSDPLPCPGTIADTGGFVMRSDNPTLQDGLLLNGRALWTHPQWVTNGVISGRFPPLDIQSGYHFKTRLGCLTGSSPACDVVYQLNYRANSGPLTSLGTWSMKYSDPPKDLDLDLSSFAGQSLEFSFAVTANGEPTSDWAIWFKPLVIK